MNPVFLTIFQTVVVLAIAPFAVGFVRTCKARLQGRHGASPFLPYVSFATLARKQMVIPENASWVFRVVPFVVLGSVVFLTLVLPLVVINGALASLSDVVLVAAVFVIGSVFLVLGGLDPGSAFGGMGSSREMTIAALMEPTMILVLGTLAVVTDSSTVNGVFVQGNLLVGHPALVFTLVAFLLLALAENARYPVDNPATHLELTMVHEAMILEYSGPYLAMLEYASAIKLTIFSLLIAHVVTPWGMLTATEGAYGMLRAVGMTVAVVVIAMALLALLESTIAKMRFYRMQEYASAAFFIALAGMLLVL